MPKQVAKKNRFVILSIDGGGIRGLIPATILIHLEKMIQKKRGNKDKIGDYFDFISGTSTGNGIDTKLTIEH
ncbi:patatin-like phospholipase family protein [Candidatus Poribacteria bacterium]|nr:patatin-like phospholipase family protein [Candidatus Poribacteria bacterium]